MRKFDKLYEGVLDRIGKSIGNKIRGTGDAIRNIGDTAARGIEKGAKGAEKLVAKAPIVGSITRANKAVAKIEDYFQNIQADMNTNRESLATLKGKADQLLSKLIDVFGDDPDKEVLQLMRRLEDRSNSIKDLFKDLTTVSSKAKAGAENTDYQKTAPEDLPKNNIQLKKQKLQFNSYKYDEKVITETVNFIETTCNEIDAILEELNKA